LKFARALRRQALYGFKKDYKVGKAKVDVAFPKQRVAVFVHGCFWHQCPVCDLSPPKTHTDFWNRKFALNKARDARVRLELEASGWKVAEFWEHEINGNVDDCARIIGLLL